MGNSTSSSRVTWPEKDKKQCCPANFDEKELSSVSKYISSGGKIDELCPCCYLLLRNKFILQDEQGRTIESMSVMLELCRKMERLDKKMSGYHN